MCRKNKKSKEECDPVSDRLAADCLSYIEANDYVSFAELERWLADRGEDVQGDYGVELHGNVFIWAGVSKRFCDIVEALHQHVDLEPCSSLLVYLTDGKLLQLPIAKRPPRSGYKDPHWLPVTLRPKQRPRRTNNPIK